MKINSIKIDKLFGIFDYDISFSENENVLIITGPNGFGKTMILNILFNLFNKRFLFFYKLIFEKITLQLDEEISIVINRITNDNKPIISFVFLQNGKKIDTFDYTTKIESELERNIQKYLPVGRVSENTWIDHRSDRILSFEDLVNEYADLLPEKLSKNLPRIKSEKVNEILNSLHVHLIREQRLFKKMDKGVFRSGVPRLERPYREEKEQTIMMESIQSYAKELKQTITIISQESFKQTQALDSSYPDRLINETNRLSEDEYTLRFNDLKIKQDKLTEFGLYESKQKLLAYSKDDSKALSVYLKDFENKLSVFDDLLEKLELFTNILNERRFTFKSIAISREKGFFFKTINGKELELNQLSSGEQHEVVLLYELIFNVQPNTLVLIDEPEISLHVTWQKEFLNDLLRIIKIQSIQVLIATHSPSIINSRWDLAYNLEKVDGK